MISSHGLPAEACLASTSESATRDWLDTRRRAHKLRASVKTPFVTRLSEKAETEAAPVRAEAWLKRHVEDILDRQRRDFGLRSQPQVESAS